MVVQSIHFLFKIAPAERGVSSFTDVHTVESRKCVNPSRFLKDVLMKRLYEKQQANGPWY